MRPETNPPRKSGHRRRPVAAAWWLLSLGLCFGASAAGAGSNGFDLSGATIPAEEILRGGPPRDGIPALDSPSVVAAAESPWSDEEMVVGITWPGGARAYPLAILVWHELVNDVVGDRPILVSYCPLCGTAIVFDQRNEKKTRRFGVSGLLYRSDLLMFDRETESLWSQISAEAVTGPSRGKRLVQIRSKMRRWGDWKAAHPDSTILSRRTGHSRSYSRQPYGDYDSSRKLFFPVPLDRRYHPKMRTVGLRLPDGRARAYPLEEVAKAGGRVVEEWEERFVAIRLDSESETFDVDVPDAVEVIEGFWFAWAAFHPGTTVFVAP